MSDLSNVKPGDVVAVLLYGRPAKLTTVSRLTPTQIVCADRSSYRKKDGKEVGYTGFAYPQISTDPRDILQMRRAEVAVSLQKPTAFTLDGIAKARALLDRAEAFIKEHGE